MIDIVYIHKETGSRFTRSQLKEQCDLNLQTVMTGGSLYSIRNVPYETDDFTTILDTGFKVEELVWLKNLLNEKSKEDIICIQIINSLIRYDFNQLSRYIIFIDKKDGTRFFTYEDYMQYINFMTEDMLNFNMRVVLFSYKHSKTMRKAIVNSNVGLSKKMLYINLLKDISWKE